MYFQIQLNLNLTIEQLQELGHRLGEKNQALYNPVDLVEAIKKCLQDKIEIEVSELASLANDRDFKAPSPTYAYTFDEFDYDKINRDVSRYENTVLTPDRLI